MSLILYVTFATFDINPDSKIHPITFKACLGFVPRYRADIQFPH